MGSSWGSFLSCPAALFSTHSLSSVTLLVTSATSVSFNQGFIVDQEFVALSAKSAKSKTVLTAVEREAASAARCSILSAPLRIFLNFSRSSVVVAASPSPYNQSSASINADTISCRCSSVDTAFRDSLLSSSALVLIMYDSKSLRAFAVARFASSRSRSMRSVFREAANCSMVKPGMLREPVMLSGRRTVCFHIFVTSFIGGDADSFFFSFSLSFFSPSAAAPSAFSESSFFSSVFSSAAAPAVSFPDWSGTLILISSSISNAASARSKEKTPL